VTNENGAVDKKWMGNRNTRRKHAAMPLCSPQIQYDLTCLRARSTAVGSRRLTAYFMLPIVTVNDGICDPIWSSVLFISSVATDLAVFSEMAYYKKWRVTYFQRYRRDLTGKKVKLSLWLIN
jgi:hypothetical protein